MFQRVSLLFSLAVALTAFSGVGAAPTLSPTKQISANGNNSLNPRLAIEGDKVIAVYERWLAGTQASAKAYRVVSNDGGKTWGPARKVWEFGDEQHNPDVAICGSYVYVVFALRVGMESQVNFFWSTDGGNIWTGPQTIGLGRASTEILRDKPRVDCHANHVWVGWSNDDVYLQHSIDNGASFLGALTLETDPALAVEKVAIANDAFNVYLAWEVPAQANLPKGAILFQKSTDAGMIFSSEITTTFRAGDGPGPAGVEMAAFGKRVALTYLSGVGSPTDVRTQVSIDRGANWPAAKTVATDARNPSIAAAKNRLDLVYGAGADVVHRASTTSGQTWLPTTIIATLRQAGAKGTAIVSTNTQWATAWTQFQGSRHRVYARQAAP